MSDLKPIETIYNGYRFRSRLEARWAVFFDALGIEYEYEPEGFDLGDGSYYLPDFYLSKFDLYIEIKPFDKNIVKHIGDNNDWEQKCALFRDVTDRAILLCYGDPAADIYKRLFAFDTCDSGGGSSEYCVNFVNHNGTIVICTEYERPDRVIYTRGFNDLKINDYVGTPSMFGNDDLWEDTTIPYDYHNHNKLNDAKTKARQARFEHGEKPFIK
jgi:hypothetical protein